MGEYIYRLAGVKDFSLVEIEGRIEKVFHMVYWWKPGYDRSGKDPYLPRNYGAMVARLEKAVAALPPELRDGEQLDAVRFVTCSKPGESVDHVYALKRNCVSFSDSLFGTKWMPLVYKAAVVPEGAINGEPAAEWLAKQAAGLL